MITDARRAELYPQPDEAGEHDTWVLPLLDGELEITGTFIGVASARQDKHSHSGPAAPPETRCPACRWYEPRVFRIDETGKYLLYTLGCSDIPGETDIPRYRYAANAHEVIFNMATQHEESGTRFLTTPARLMFRMAANHDPDIAEALTSGGWIPSGGRRTPAHGTGHVWRTA